MEDTLYELSKNDPQFIKLKASRKPPQTGDIFIWKITSYPDFYGVGRVIDPDANWDGDKVNAIVLYKYKLQSIDEIPIRLPRKDIAGPPYLVSNANWTLGYFQTVQKREFDEGEFPKQVLFCDDLRGFIADVKGERLTGFKKKPRKCGDWGLHCGLTYLMRDPINRAWRNK